MKIINPSEDNILPIYSWCENIESGAMSQIENLSKHPSMFHHIAIMPDCHQGYGMPIGGVIACNDSLIPNAIGVDQNCGMCFVETNIPTELLKKDLLEKIIKTLYQKIPVGMRHHKERQDINNLMDYSIISEGMEVPIINSEFESAAYQIGTLGGGNHFIELQRNEKDNLCIMLHSGSRNIGYKIANEYNNKAKKLNENWKSNIDPTWDLAFLPIDSKEGKEFLKATKFSGEFAKQNRFLMMERIKNITFNLIKKYTSINSLDNIEVGLEVNIHHNYANLEHHFGKNVWVHRKGATSALKDQLGIIPGSMGTSSYIVKGLGNPDSFMSCSHGSGRVMGRNEASRQLTKTQCDKDMEGIVFKGWAKHSSKKMKGKTDFGEAPRAYKDIDNVINSQLDLIEPIMKLKPIGVVKE